MQHFVLIQAICRAALSNPTKAIVQQIERLMKAIENDGNTKEAKILHELLTSKEKSIDMSPSKLQHSRMIIGEHLTSNTQIPVDKETSTPLAEIIFESGSQVEAPVLNPDITLAIESLMKEWSSFDELMKIDAQPSRSCLIYGSPGTGKTHLALWIASKIGLPVVLARLDGLMSSFLGTTSRNIGNLFSFASKYRCVLLLDEFDAIAKLRDDPHEVGEIKRVVNTLLQNLDFRKNVGFTISITNHERLLDPAIWRRFDTQIHIPRPSKFVIPTLLRRFLTPLSLNENEISFLSWASEGSTGADIQALALWIKKSKILDSESTLVEQVQKFTLLNNSRIIKGKKEALFLPDIDLINLLLKDQGNDFSQKDVSHIFKISQPSMSKLLSKQNNHG